MTLSLPVTLDDAAALFDIVRQYAPAPLIRDVMVGVEGGILVRIFDGKVQVFERTLKPR